MASGERSPVKESTSCSGRDDLACSGTHTQEKQKQQDGDDGDDEFVMVELMDEMLQERSAPARQWSCSLPRVRVHSCNPAEGVDIAMGESGLAASEPLTAGELMQRTVMRVPHHIALRYKTGDTWNDITYREYYNQCIAAAKSFIKVRRQSISKTFSFLALHARD